MKRPLLFVCCIPACVLVVDAAGPVVEEQRDVAAFDAVDNRTFVDLTVTEGFDGVATLRCDEDLADRLVVEVVDGALVVRATRGWTLGARGPCTLTVGADTLSAVSVSGSGSVDVQLPEAGVGRVDVSGSGAARLDAALAEVVALRVSGSGALDVERVQAVEVTVDASGSGGARVAGVTEALDVDVSGSGAVDALDLDAVDVVVRGSGSGWIGVQASGSVSGALTGSGDLRVTGGADVDVDVSGSGRVVR